MMSPGARSSTRRALEYCVFYSVLVGAVNQVLFRWVSHVDRYPCCISVNPGKKRPNFYRLVVPSIGTVYLVVLQHNT